jgi:L-malate glycosyltransferase
MINSRRLLIVQRRMAHYRVQFFETLKTELALRSIELVVANGSDNNQEMTKGDSGKLDWSVRLHTSYYLDGRICWQPFGDLMRSSDMVVITQENKLLYNVVPQIFKNSSKVALWGHGANLQGDSASLRERYKRWTTRNADWWFCYTEMSRNLVEQSGFPRERISVLNNSVDTAELIAAFPLSATTVDAVRKRHGIMGSRVGIFVGSLYAEKRLPFLFEACLQIRRLVPDFELIFVGAGPEERAVREFCEKYSWAHYLGVCKGREKATLISISRVMINPGLVGLGVLDSFVCGVPLVTTNCGLHSPEIIYLRDNFNGLMTEDSIDSFVSAASSLLINDALFNRLRIGCQRSAELYSVENMAYSFADGVSNCLSTPRAR